MEFVWRKVHLFQFFIHHNEAYIAFKSWYHWNVDAVQVAFWEVFSVFSFDFNVSQYLNSVLIDKGLF